MKFKRLTVFVILILWAFMAWFVFAESTGYLNDTPEQAAHSFEEAITSLGEGLTPNNASHVTPSFKHASHIPLSCNVCLLNPNAADSLSCLISTKPPLIHSNFSSILRI